MQTIKYKFLGALLLVVLAASSCVKNNGYADTIDDAGQYVADIAEAGAEELNALALNSVPALEDVTLCQVRIGSKTVPNKAFVIKLASNTTLITDYNTANGTNYVALPAAAYTGSFDITVPAGKRTADAVIKLNKNALNLANAYAIGLTIAQVDNGGIISSTAKNLVVAILVKNAYDGIYLVKGTTLRAGDPAKTGAFVPFERGLATSGSNSVAWDGLQLWADGTGVGIGNPAFAVSGDNTINISSSGGAVNSSTQGSGITSSYDPAKKTFYADFTWGAGLAARRSTDTLVYLRPR